MANAIRDMYEKRNRLYKEAQEINDKAVAELAERGKPAAERAAVSEAPQPVREFVDVLEESKKARGDLEAAIRRVANRIKVGPGTISNLVRNRVKSICFEIARRIVSLSREVGSAAPVQMLAYELGYVLKPLKGKAKRAAS